MSLAVLMSVFIFIVCILGGVPSAAGGWKASRENLDERYAVDRDYMIFYTRFGQDAFSGGATLDALAKQIKQAVRVYNQYLGLEPPLSLPRYAKVQRIDVHILDLGNDKGSAGDGVHIFNYIHFGREGPALTLAISNTWQPPNRTPEHEVFHAYQYAYTFFKNAWFLEGLARSMANLFSDGSWKSDPLPADNAELDAVLTKSYKADRFWNRLALLCDPGCKFEPHALGTAHSESTQWVCGRAIVRELLVALDIADNAVAGDRDLSQTEWPEKEQWARENEPYMLGALADVVAMHCPVATNPELRTFLKLLRSRAEAARR